MYKYLIVLYILITLLIILEYIKWVNPTPVPCIIHMSEQKNIEPIEPSEIFNQKNTDKLPGGVNRDFEFEDAFCDSS